VVRAGPPAKPPSDPLALKVPAEVYYLKGADEFIQLDLKPVVSLREPGKMSKFSPVKGHVVGSVIGPAAMARVAKGPLPSMRVREKRPLWKTLSY
jgi:hypothetical protein